MSDRLHLSLDAGQAQALLRRLVSSAHAPAQALAALNALDLLLGIHTETGDQHKPLFHALREQISALLAQQRHRLLVQQSQRLTGAIAARDPAAIAGVLDASCRRPAPWPMCWSRCALRA